MKKKLALIIFIVTLTLGITGCYTTVWNPNSEFPTADNSYMNDGYYSDYYGNYAYYYDTPWWYAIAPPAPVTVSNPNYQRGEDRNSLRNTGYDRGNEGRRPEVQRTDPVSTSTGSNSSSTSTSSNGSRVTSQTENKSSSSNRDNKSLRDNNGDRNNGRRR